VTAQQALAAGGPLAASAWRILQNSRFRRRGHGVRAAAEAHSLAGLKSIVNVGYLAAGLGVLAVLVALAIRRRLFPAKTRSTESQSRIARRLAWNLVQIWAVLSLFAVGLLFTVDVRQPVIVVMSLIPMLVAVCYACVRPEEFEALD